MTARRRTAEEWWELRRREHGATTIVVSGKHIYIWRGHKTNNRGTR